ncbi:hypothetical protein EA462_11610 [Natrarchaeobius halalkaliphilus]|uniref:Uncharacterized protein n=1 Tax=Natrarchaeobius halalkaliphilus TaxID=1679091 RepID=A0A3N6MUF5_9EURY|nr:hypothetical protein EA462_11610 [Natrarchaeobius halalkaliphilus]
MNHQKILLIAYYLVYIMSESETEKSILKWFVLPATLTFFLVNLFQISPILSVWTTSVIGGGNILWVILIPTYSLLLAVLVGFCGLHFPPPDQCERPV